MDKLMLFNIELYVRHADTLSEMEIVHEKAAIMNAVKLALKNHLEGFDINASSVLSINVNE